ncbi:MAG TPA: hypothetical protein VF376_02010 [Thermoanaerobaculia bacterium]
MKANIRILVLGFGVVAMTAACQKSESPSPNVGAASSDAHPPFGMLGAPLENVPVDSGGWGFGWALDDSGIASVTVSFDGGPAAAAKTGDPFPGVKEAYPNFPDNDRAGFIFAIPKLSPGPHSLSVTLVAKDSGQTILRRQFQAR